MTIFPGKANRSYLNYNQFHAAMLLRCAGVGMRPHVENAIDIGRYAKIPFFPKHPGLSIASCKTPTPFGRACGRGAANTPEGAARRLGSVVSGSCN